MKVLVAQSCPTLCHPMDCSLPGSSVHGILRDSPGFSRNWSGLPFLSPGDLPNPGTEPRSPALPADSLLPEPLGVAAMQETRVQSLSWEDPLEKERATSPVF